MHRTTGQIVWLGQSRWTGRRILEVAADINLYHRRRRRRRYRRRCRRHRRRRHRRREVSLSCLLLLL